MAFQSNLSLIDENCNLENSKNYILSIRCKPNGFSFSVLDDVQKKFIALESYYLQKTDTKPGFFGNSYIESIHALFEKNNLLKAFFKSVIIIIDNHNSTLIPAEFFSEAIKENYLKFANGTFTDEIVESDNINELNTYNVFAFNKSLKDKLINYFPSASFIHHSTLLLKNLLADNSGQKVYINVGDLKFDLIVLNNKNLEFYNSFVYESSEDFIYYVLFAIKQLNLNPENLNLVILGEIEKDSAVYKISYKYIRNIEFVSRKTSFKHSEEIKNLPAHYHYTLLNK